MTGSPDRFFVPGVSQYGRVRVGRDEARHMIRVLRMKCGDELIAFDGEGAECRCRIVEAAGRDVVVEVLERREVSREPAVAVTLAVAAAKTKAMDLIVRKCTELGLWRLIPFHSGRSIAKIKDSSKIEKWRRAAIEAAKQCGRNVLPQIAEPADRGGLAEAIRNHDLAVVAAPSEGTATLKQVLEENPSAKRILCLVGPEGGWRADELAELAEAGALPVSLGPSILRVETAAIAALAMIAYHYSD